MRCGVHGGIGAVAVWGYLPTLEIALAKPPGFWSTSTIILANVVFFSTSFLTAPHFLGDARFTLNEREKGGGRRREERRETRKERGQRRNEGGTGRRKEEREWRKNANERAERGEEGGGLGGVKEGETKAGKSHEYLLLNEFRDNFWAWGFARYTNPSRRGQHTNDNTSRDRMFDTGVYSMYYSADRESLHKKI